MGRKADYTTIVPLTHAKHMELHRIGQKSFESRYGVNLKAAAQLTEIAWQIHKNLIGLEGILNLIEETENG